MRNPLSAAIPRSIGTQVAASTADDEVEAVFQHPATLRNFSLRIYLGAELDLEIRVFIVTAEGEREKILPSNAEGKQYIDGDDDIWQWPGSEISVESRDRLVILADNNDGTNAYDYRFNFVEDRHGGVQRVLATLREWF